MNEHAWNHAWKHVLSALIAFGLFTTAAAQSVTSTVDASAFSEAVFYTDLPEAGGEVVARIDASAAASADVEGATHLVLEGADRAYTFVLATEAFVEGRLRLAVAHIENGAEVAITTYADVVARLTAALEGRANIVVFTDGVPEDGVVVAIFEVDAETRDVQISHDTATHAVVYADGRAEVFEVIATGGTLAATRISSDGDSSAVEVAGELDLDTSVGDAVEGGAGVGVGVGVGVDGN